VEHLFIPEVVWRRGRRWGSSSFPELLWISLEGACIGALECYQITPTLPAHCSHNLDHGIFNIFSRRLLAFKRHDFIPLNQCNPSYRRVLYYARGAFHEAFSPVTMSNESTRVTSGEIVPPKPSHPTATQVLPGKVVTA
jgi:hypothetical protein